MSKFAAFFEGIKIGHALMTAAVLCAPPSFFDGDPAEQPIPAKAAEEPAEAVQPFPGEKPKDQPAVTIPQRPQREPRGVILTSQLPDFLTAAPQKQELIGISPAWCIHCPAAKARLIDNPHFEINWRTQENEHFPVYPSVYDPASKSYHRPEDLQSWETLEASINKAREGKNVNARYTEPEAPMRLGSIDRATVDMILDLFGEPGKFQLNNRHISIPFGSVSIDIPKRAGGETFVYPEPRGTQINFNRETEPTLGFIHIWAFRINANTLFIGLEWLPDISLRIVEGGR